MRLPVTLFTTLLLLLFTSQANASSNYIPIMVGDIVVFVTQDIPPEPKADVHTFNSSPQGGLHQLPHEFYTLKNDKEINGLAEVIVDLLPYAPIPGVDLIRSSSTQMQYNIQPGYVGQFSFKYRLKYKYRASETEYHYSLPTDVLVVFRPQIVPPGNRPPVANTDVVTVPLNQNNCNKDLANNLNCNVSINLLANDRDDDGDFLHFIKLAPSSDSVKLYGEETRLSRYFDNRTLRGLIKLGSNGQLTYTAVAPFFDRDNASYYPARGPGGTYYDTFKYIVSDPFGQQSVGEVFIELENREALIESDNQVPPAKTKQFKWEPSVVAVGSEASFIWDIENVKSCYGQTTETTDLEYKASKGTESHIATVPGTYTTQWTCIDLKGKPYPADGTKITATRTVVSSETELKGTLKWEHTEVFVGQTARLSWNLTNAVSCTVTGPVVNGSIGNLNSSDTFTPYTVGDIVSKWQCKNSQGAALAPREVTLKVKPLTKPILRKE